MTEHLRQELQIIVDGITERFGPEAETIEEVRRNASRAYPEAILTERALRLIRFGLVYALTPAPAADGETT